MPELKRIVATLSKAICLAIDLEQPLSRDLAFILAEDLVFSIREGLDEANAFLDVVDARARDAEDLKDKHAHV